MTCWLDRRPALRSLELAAVATVLLGSAGCGPRSIDDDDGGSVPGDAFFEMGQGINQFRFVEDGDELEMVLGGQGLLMFPMPVRGGGFELPPDPSDYNHPKIPLLDATIDIDGFNTGVGGHFIYLANYRIPFTVRGNGDYEFNYVALIVPDELEDYSQLDGRMGHVHAELSPHGLDEPLIFDRDVIIDTDGVVGEPLGATP